MEFSPVIGHNLNISTLTRESRTFDLRGRRCFRAVVLLWPSGLPKSENFLLPPIRNTGVRQHSRCGFVCGRFVFVATSRSRFSAWAQTVCMCCCWLLDGDEIPVSSLLFNSWRFGLPQGGFLCGIRRSSDDRVKHDFFDSFSSNGSRPMKWDT